jgi:hypothetical protein
MERDVLDCRVHPLHFGMEVGEHLLPVFSTDQEGPRIADHTIDVMNEFMRGSDGWRRSKRGKGFRRTAEGFLSTVRERSQKMPQ